jgi:hypothetical protein
MLTADVFLSELFSFFCCRPMNDATVGTPPLGEPRIADKVAAFLVLDSVFFLLVDPFCFLSTVETLLRALF